MLRQAIDLMRQVMPASGDLQILNKFQYRALKPTWPVAFSLAFLSAAFLLPDQGRAIIKFTIGEIWTSIDNPGQPWGYLKTPLKIVLLTVHGLVMMYTAFMLSAVTRRSQIDSDSTTSARSDPIDPSINLRLRYAYFCGVLLPIQFMLMSLWFAYGLLDLWFWAAVLIGLVIGVACTYLAGSMYLPVSRRLAYYNRSVGAPSIGQSLRYSGLRIAQFCVTPEHRKAQIGIVAIAATLATLTARNILEPTQLFTHALSGAWMFFGCFLSLHLIYRYYKNRVIRLHHGHSARYIIIDPTIETRFRWLRRFGIIVIPIVFWFPATVAYLGPLGIGLFGTLWICLVLSGLIESSARHARANSAQEVSSEQNSLSIKSWFFLALMGLLIFELMLAAAENLIFDKRPSLDVLIFVILFGVILLRKKIWPQKRDFRLAVNRLPSVSVLAPILLLSLGEAHHIHRYDVGNSSTSVIAKPLDEHAEAWLKARNTSDLAAQEIPAIVILAEGGGIRAGAHTAYYLSALDDQLREACQTRHEEIASLCQRGEHTRLLDLTYSINGVSGGAVGAAVYLAAVKEENTYNLQPEARLNLIDATIGADYISVLFAGLFGSDLLTAIIPVQVLDRTHGLLIDRSNTDGVSRSYNRGVYDRADFFEDRMTRVFHNSLTDIVSENGLQAADSKCGRPESGSLMRTFDQTLEWVAYCAAQNADASAVDDPGPAVFFSTFYETGGYQMATSNVDILYGNTEGNTGAERDEDSMCGSVPIVQQLLPRDPSKTTLASPLNCTPRDQTLPLSTAAHLSARFPISNPTGVVETRYSTGRWKRHHFVDGGYMDNSGALSAIQSVEALRRAAHKQGATVNVIVLQLYTLPIGDAPTSPRQEARATKQNEFNTIPSAVLKARNAASRAPLRLLCNSLYEYADFATVNGKGPAANCDTIFERKIVTNKDIETVFTESAFTTAMNVTDEQDDAGSALSCPSAPDRMDLIALNMHQAPADAAESLPTPNGIGFTAASWIPAPIEIAKTDRQDNAITALLGWTLLEETTTAMKQILPGAANYTVVQLAEATDGVEILPSQTTSDTFQSRCAP